MSDELDAEAATIGFPQLFHQIAQGAISLAIEAGFDDWPIQIGACVMPKFGQIQQRMGRPAMTERIEFGDEMPEFAIGVNQIINAGGEQPLGVWRLARIGTAGRLISCSPGVKTREKRLPLRVHRTGVFLVLRVKLVDVLGVTAINDIERLHDWVEL